MAYFFSGCEEVIQQCLSADIKNRRSELKDSVNGGIMSLTSTFWTLHKPKLDQLLSESRPIEKKVGNKPFLSLLKQKTKIIYPWFDYLNKNSSEEKNYGLSGMIMADFDLMLMESSTSIFSIRIRAI